MSLKKLLGVISIVILTTFILMLTTSYAWYAFENGSTTFDVVTNNDNIIVSFLRGEYINTNVAVPIASEDVDQYSEKNNFIVRVKDNPVSNEIVLTVSLVDISIDGSLQNENFKIELYHQNKSVASIAGNVVGTSGATTKTLGTVVLDDDVDNNFELRVYILDNGEDQSALMNKTFQAKIQIDSVSRLKTTMNDYSDPDIYVSSITIDGESSDYLPTSGYYSMTSSCTKGSTLTWEPLSKTITYGTGSYANDSCSLTFTSSTDYPLLSEMPVGSYVKYTGTNGCDGKHCEGYNANYESDKSMGYCDSSGYKFTGNGWRIGYIQNDRAYLISAGAPECVATYMDSKSTGVGVQTLSTNYYYGSGYKFNEATGKFTLTGVTSSTLSWSDNYVSIVSNTPYTCKSTSATSTCITLYEITEYYSNTQGKAYTHYNYDAEYGVPTHLANLDNKALKYCNEDYAYGGSCNSNSAWAINDTDFYYMTKAINGVGKRLTEGSSSLGDSGGTLGTTLYCYNKSSYQECGYNNDLIDNGGYYWFAAQYSSSSTYGVYWIPNSRGVANYSSASAYGLRPVISLSSSVYVTGGLGTMDDPYVIANG